MGNKHCECRISRGSTPQPSQDSTSLREFEQALPLPLELIRIDPSNFLIAPKRPLDGGLTAILLAGGAVGYRKFRGRKEQLAK